MQLSIQTVINMLEQLAPKHLAYDWDNVGLHVGSYQGTVSKIYVALDATEDVIAEAENAGADLIVTHHPFIFKPIKAVRTDQMPGKLIEKAILSGIRIYCAHTNLDLANGGVNDALAECLGLLETKALRPSGQTDLEKIAVFVPHGHEDNVHRAMAAAGAGWIGGYSHCSFQASGTGTFMPREGTSPFLGEVGKLEKTQEIRLETIIPAALRNRVVRAMIKAHPYEEVAYDLYPLLNAGETFGLGRVGILAQTYTLAQFCQWVKERLQISFVRATGDPNRKISKVAVCGGAGSDLLHMAKFAGADVLVTSDVKYDVALDANASDIAVIDAGHDATERVIVPVLREYLQNKLNESGYDIEVVASTIETAPWCSY